MANTSRNFVAGKMNKGLDERLLPNGQYIDAVNVRLGSTETTEIGAVENSRGNERLTSIEFNNQPLSNDAICIGAFGVGEEETMYWFVHDPSFGLGSTGKCDMIVSFNTNSEVLTYHVVSIDDGGGVNTTLNFDPQFLVLGVTYVDDLLFFTDNNNQPRFINVRRNYNAPLTPNYIDEFTAESLLVIKKPPVTAPLISPQSGGDNNYLEDRFVCFGYRYKYADNEYSATSPFSQPSFIPGPFNFSPQTFLNDGMLNTTNIAEITYNSGDELVVGIDLLFKDMNSGTIKVIEKLDKSDLGIPNNSEQQYTFSNSKIFTILADSEILRLYDNVPLKAKAQTLMGNRLMYGNYFEGYDLVDAAGTAIKLEYTTELISEFVEFRELNVNLTAGDYTIAGGAAVSIPDTVVNIDLTDIDLVAGASINIDFDIVHQSFDASGQQLTDTNGNIELTFNYLLTQDYPTLQDLLNDADFIDSIQLLEPNFADACNGTSLTDEFNCDLQLTLDTTYEKTGTGITGIGEPFLLASGSPTNPNTLVIQINAAEYVDSTNPANVAYEYLQLSLAQAEYTKVANAKSLKSNRGYEIGIIYLDEFMRASTALVSPNNTQSVPCELSVSQNKIRVEIPPTQLPPSFAKYYKFCIKADKEGYDVIYSNLYFKDATLGATWFRLEGENSQKIEVGDKLFVKADTNGPKRRCTEVTVLEKEAKEEDFITPKPTDAAGEPVVVPSGTYMLIATNQISTELGDNPVIEDDRSDKSSRNCPKVFMNVCTVPNPDYDPLTYDPLDPTTFAFIPFDIPAGSTMRINYFNRRNGGPGNACELRECVWETTATASQDYANVKDFFDGDNIFGLTSQSECRTDTSDSPSVFSYDPTLGTFDVVTIFGVNAETSSDLDCELGTNFIRFLDYNGTDQDLSGKQTLGMTGTKGCGGSRNRQSVLDVEITIIRSNSLIIFESDPQDAAPDIWYESSKTYPIFDEECAIDISVDSAEPSPLQFDYDIQGVSNSVVVAPGTVTTVYGDCNTAAVSGTTPPSDPANINIVNTPISGSIHTGNIQDQTPNQSAIIDTEFFNCFAFGNGVESFKIQDSIVGKPLELGNRVTSTSEQDYKEAHRFADITYSGVINDESNINRLNQFNLGLLNFKPLEDKYGPITVLDGRETDILVLQEDKISYVLTGKNLLSDSAGGGAVTSVPEVLGTQIARIEEYGNSNNPESYVQWGADKFFTDAKRGAVLQLKGTTGQSEQLGVISETGMRSFFRDYFIESFNTFKFGGYDPYMNEYVLNRSDREQPFEPPVINCGVTQTVLWTGANTLQYVYDLGGSVGPVEVTTTVTNYDGTPIPILGTYNGVDVINASLTGNGTVTFSFNKQSVVATELLLQLQTGGAGNESVNVEITVTCPDAPLIDIIQVAITSDNEAGQLIHDEYRWTDGIFVSALQSEQVVFGNGTGLIVSQFTQTQAAQGGNLVPANGATVRIISNKIPADGDDFNFDPFSNKFRYLRTNVNYTNSPTSIAALLANPNTQLATPILGGGNVYEATFAMPNTSDSKLYLVWDYRKPTPLELCYSSVSAEEACCDCSGTPIPDANRFADLCINVAATPGSGQPLQVVVPPQSGVTENTFVTVAAAPNCVYKVGVETQNNPTTTINTVLTNISSCLQVCNTYTITGGTGGGSYSYKDCGGTVQSGNTVAEGVSDQVCAQSISTTNTTNTMDCSCLLTWEVERCQIDNTGVKPIEYIVQDGVVQIGDIVTLTGEGECTYNVLQSSSNAATATLNSIVAECACNEYTIENPSPTETRTFFYTDCDDQVQTLTLTPTSVQIRCIKSFTQPQQFNVAFYSCGCPILP